ncbi:MAG: hypothetical protein IV100_03895 [Myxococcales bacterium]|nr:hypothetical protein [Myxococcales bacterium]
MRIASWFNETAPRRAALAALVSVQLLSCNKAPADSPSTKAAASPAPVKAPAEPPSKAPAARSPSKAPAPANAPTAVKTAPVAPKLSPPPPKPLDLPKTYQAPPADKPTSEKRVWFGVKIGESSVADVQAQTAAMKLTCEDTSIRAVMGRMRDKAAAEAKAAEAAKAVEAAKAAEEAKAKGLPVPEAPKVDTVARASFAKKKDKPGAHESNPQVRFTCNDAASSSLTDRERTPSTGRFLVVFDSADVPARHASFRRAHRDVLAALADVSTTLAAFKATYGEPTKSDVFPAMVDGAAPAIPNLRNFTAIWSFANFEAKVTLLRSGGSYDILESAEVPWPTWVSPVQATRQPGAE